MNINQKGFVNIILIIAVVVLIGVAGYFGWVRKSEPVVEQSPSTQTLTPTPQVSNNQPAPIPTPSGETTNWKTYRSELYGLEVSYPSDWSISLNRASKLSIAGFCSPATKSACKNYDGDIVLDLVNSSLSQEKFNQYCKTNFEQSGDYSKGIIENKVNYAICRLPGLETLFRGVYIFHNSFLFSIYRHPESSSPASYAVSEEDFEQILSTIKFIK
ncbi:MAG: hypothetical protein UY64_C0032G0002 [Parcubacteria group bacterium GW2011_GWA1_51_12]|nr:MAG: hypothetical protein UY64_C0032G0002 [Parcubacteria group bacterium GW2011_GWA1_51_12]